MMNSKAKYLKLILSLLAIIAVFSVITVAVTRSALAEQTATEAEETKTELKADSANPAVSSGDKAAAEALIDQKFTKEELEEKLGTCKEFKLETNGCEKGVFAGFFYYDGYVIRSRSYDGGKTFTITSVN